jgi:hypothetical protein
MNRGMLTLCMLVSLAGSALAPSASAGAEGTDETLASGLWAATSAPRSSWEAWLRHAGHALTPPRGLNLDTAASSRPPALAPESGLPGTEGGHGPGRLGSDSGREGEESGAAGNGP